MGWTAIGLAVVMYLAGSNIGSGWIVILAATLIAAPLLDLLVVTVTAGRTSLDLAVTGAPVVGLTGLAVTIRRPAGLTGLRIAAGEGTTRGTTRQAKAIMTGRVRLARGRHRTIQVDTETVGALGLAVVHRTIHAPCDLIVRPASHASASRVRLLLADSDDRQAPIRQDVDISSIRPFVQGDPQRLVHWRATARHGQVMVREHARSGGGGLIGLHLAGGEWSPAVLDLACTIIASLADQATSDGHGAHLFMDGHTLSWDHSATRRLATLPPANDVQPRPLATPPAGDVGAAVHLSAQIDGVLVALPGRTPILLADETQVLEWLRS